MYEGEKERETEREREREREIIGDDQSRNQTDEELRNFLER